MKLHYSTASVNELDWILFPTAKAVEGITGISFQKEALTGYVNWDVQIIIAKSCAGINFLIVLVIMLAVMNLRSQASLKKKWLSLPGILLFSYMITIFANAIRIVLSIYCFQLNIFSHWLTKDRFHRITGVIIFFTILSIMYHISLRITSGKHSLSKHMTPLLCYIGITIALPLIRTPLLFQNTQFIEHSLIIVMVSLIILTLVFGADKIFSGKKKI